MPAALVWGTAVFSSLKGLCPAQMLLVQHQGCGEWKSAPVMPRVIWKCLRNSPFLSFSIHLSLPQLSPSLWCVYSSLTSALEVLVVQGAIPTSLPGLGLLDCIAELAVAQTPYTPHRNGNFCIFTHAALTSGHLNLDAYDRPSKQAFK